MSHKAVFLDRDGTIIKDTGYPNDPSKVELLPGSVEALLKLQKKFLLIVISNQSGVGRGMITENEFKAVHEAFKQIVEKHGVEITEYDYCPHAPEALCDCRKPSPKLILDAAMNHEIDLPSSFMLGDKRSDVEAGHRAGCQSIYINPGQTDDSGHQNTAQTKPDFIAKDLSAAADWILKCTEEDS